MLVLRIAAAVLMINRDRTERQFKDIKEAYDVLMDPQVEYACPRCCAPRYSLARAHTCRQAFFTCPNRCYVLLLRRWIHWGVFAVGRSGTYTTLKGKLP